MPQKLVARVCPSDLLLRWNTAYLTLVDALQDTF
jgi:hypothetical protein